MNFKCPACNCNKLETAFLGFRAFTFVLDVSAETGIKYDTPRLFETEDKRGAYQCFGCGYVIATDEDELIDYLQKNNMFQY